jgi:vancomycin resistance protein YoaR
VTAGAVLGLALVGYLAAYAAVGPGVPRGTSVAGVTIGGLEPAAATAALRTQVAPRADSVTVSVDGRPTDLPAGALGLAFDAEASVAAAGERSVNPVVLIRQLFGQDLAPAVVVDEQRLERRLQRLASGFDQAPRQGAVRYEGLEVVVVEPRAGRELDLAAAADRVRRGYLVSDGPIALPTVVAQPEVTAEQVRQVAAGAAVTAVSAPVTVRAGGGEVVISPAQLAAHLAFVPEDGQLVPRLRTQALRAEVADQLDRLEKPAVDASFRVSGGAPVVVPSSAGRGIAADAFATAVLSAMSSPDVRVATATLTRIEPDLTTSEAKELGITEVVSTFTQEFPYAAYRVTNIGVAARNMNGTVLEPGETFSLNGVVGERLPENGFVKGYIIVGNRLVEDYGGAVSTITTATWHAAFFAGMTRVEQRAHGFWIPRYLPGLEATVSWGNLDLRFRNDTPYGVLVTASVTDTSVTVTLWSTKYWDIRAEFGPRTNPRPAGKVYDDGPDCVAQTGVDGFDITVTRVWSRQGEVKRREPLETSYSPAPTVVCAPKPDPKPDPKPSDKPDPKPSDKPDPKPDPKPSGGTSGGA